MNFFPPHRRIRYIFMNKRNKANEKEICILFLCAMRPFYSIIYVDFGKIRDLLKIAALLMYSLQKYVQIFMKFRCTEIVLFTCFVHFNCEKTCTCNINKVVNF